MTTWPEFRAAVEANDRVASTRLARALDVPEATFQTWRRRHAARQLHRGAWTTTPRPDAATWLRCSLDVTGSGTALASRSALWALGGADPDCTPRPLEVVTNHEAAHLRIGPVHVRRSRTLLPEDLTEANGWTSTTPERTALDLAATLQDDAARAVVIDLLFVRQTTATRLLARADETPTAWGAGRLRRVTTPLATAPVDSVFEWDVRRSLREGGIAVHPGPHAVHTSAGSFELDIVLADAQVAIECDGATHRTPQQQARDARKGNALTVAGWALLRTTWHDFQRNPAALIAQVHAARRIHRLGRPSVQIATT